MATCRSADQFTSGGRRRPPAWRLGASGGRRLRATGPLRPGARSGSGRPPRPTSVLAIPSIAPYPQSRRTSVARALTLRLAFGRIHMPLKAGKALIWNGLSRRRFAWWTGWVRGMRAGHAGSVWSGARSWSGRAIGWWPGHSRDGATRRDGVDRLTATLIFAGWDRTSAIRRKVPLTRFASARPWHRAPGDRSCSGGVPARRARGHLLGRSRAVNGQGGQAVISAHRNPASSRAMAAATMLLVCLRAASRRKRLDRRCCAAHARARIAGSRPCWRRASSPPTLGRCW